jgi:sugar phosphate isomerase/epimerase
VPSRIAFSTLAFPDATLAAAVSAGRRWGYSGVELRLIDGELIDPAMPAERRAQVRRTLAAAGLPVVAVDSSIRLTSDDPGPDLRRFLQLAGGYPHWISVEWEKRWHPEIEDPEVALPQHLDLLTAWLKSDL